MAKLSKIFSIIALTAVTSVTVADTGDEDPWSFSYTPDKGLVAKTADGQFKFHLSNRVQMRYTQSMPEVGEDIGSFRVRRWKFKMDGHAFTYWKYKLQVNFASGSVEGSNDALLEDAYFQYTKNHWVQPFFGQGKTFFARQALTSSGKQQFVDRSIATSGGGAEVARQIGAGVIGTDKNKKFEYDFGIYNGDGTNSINKKTNENDEFLFVGRVVWTPFGEYKLSEGALDRPESSRLAIGIKAEQDTMTEAFDPDGPGAEDPFPVDLDRTAFGAELAYKIHGFSFVTEYFRATLDSASSAMPPAVEISENDIDIYYGQAGYLIGNNLEVAARYAVLDPKDTVVSEQITETGFALSYYWRAHSYKIQGDYRQIDFDADPTRDTKEARVQIQLVF